MLVCKRCASELNENNRFCSQCGAPVAGTPEIDTAVSRKTRMPASDHATYCGKCGARLPESCEHCLICGTKAGEAPPAEEIIEPEPDSEPACHPAHASQRHSKRLMTICVSLCAVLALTAASVWLHEALPYLSPAGKTRAKSAVIYSTPDKLLKFKSPSMDAPEVITADYVASVSGLARTSPDGSKIAYVNNKKLLLYDLSRAALPEAPKSDDTVIYDAPVSDFFFALNGSVLVYLASDGTLAASDFATSWTLGQDISEIIDHNESHVLYSGKAVDGGFPVYVSTVSKQPDNAAVHIGDGILSLEDYTPAFDRFIYTRSGSNKGQDIYSYDAKLGNHKTLAVGVGKIIATDAKSFTVLYQTETANPLRYENLINDDFRRQDDKVIEPDLNDYPLLNEYFDTNEFDTDNLDAEDKENPEDSEDLAEQRASFFDALDAFYEKREHDKLRAEINSEIDKFVAEHPTLYDLHLYREGSIVRLAEGSFMPFDTAALDAVKGFALWSVTNFRDSEKILFSEYFGRSNPVKLNDTLTEGITENLFVQQFGYVPFQISIGGGSYYYCGWQLTEKGDGIYFAAGTGSPVGGYPLNSATLYRMSIQNGSASNLIIIDENVAGIGGMLSNNRLLYFKDRSEDDFALCDLHILNGATSVKIGDNAAVDDRYLKLENSGKTLLYCEHFDSASQTGTLFMLTNETRQLATEVRDIYYENDLLVYFLRGFGGGQSALYSFSDDGLGLIDENVKDVLA